MKRKEITFYTIKQENDASCFNSRSNGQNSSYHNKRAKRHSSKILRKDLLKIMLFLQGFPIGKQKTSLDFT